MQEHTLTKDREIQEKDTRNEKVKEQEQQPTAPTWSVRPPPYSPNKELSTVGQFIVTEGDNEEREMEIEGQLQGKFGVTLTSAGDEEKSESRWGINRGGDEHKSIESGSVHRELSVHSEEGTSSEEEVVYFRGRHTPPDGSLFFKRKMSSRARPRRHSSEDSITREHRRQNQQAAARSD